MNTTEALNLVNLSAKKSTYKTRRKNKDIKQRWEDVYYGMSLHTTGACPAFIPLGRNVSEGRNLNNGAGKCFPQNYFGEEYQFIFENYLFSRHPRENEYTREWRFSQYKPLTRAPFQQITELITGAIFQDSNYSIDIPDKEDNSFVWGPYFEGHDLVGWFANVGIPNIMEDPNGVIVRIPTYRWNENPEGKVQVSVKFIQSRYIEFRTDKEIVYIDGKYAYHIDQTTIWRFTYDEDSKQYIIAPGDEDGYYAHGFGRLPLDVGGGIWNTQGFFDSFLVKAKAIADEYVSSYSAEQMIDKEASHPWITIAQDDCPQCQGSGGHTEECASCPGGREFIKCDRCAGSGLVSQNPGDRLYAPKEDMKEGELIRITNPDIGLNTYHHEKNNQLYEKMLRALLLYKTDKAESGEAKAIDQEAKYQFISKISNHLFDKVIYGTITDIIAYRNVVMRNGRLSPAVYEFSIIKPTQYQIKTAADLLEEYKAGKDAGLPIFIRQRMAFDYIDKQYSGDPLLKKKAWIIFALDPTAIYTEDEKLTMSASGTIDRNERVFSLQLPDIVDTAIREKGVEWFLKSDLDKIKVEVLRLYEPLRPQAAIMLTDNNGNV